MAAQRSRSSKGNRGSAKKSTSSKSGTRRSKKETEAIQARRNAFRQEVILWLIIAISLLLFISNLGIGGIVGNAVSGFLFGVFGLFAYIVPFFALIGSVFLFVNHGKSLATFKFAASVLILFFLCMFACLMIHGEDVLNPIAEYSYGTNHRTGGGFVGACLAYSISIAFGQVGAYIIDIIAIIICLVFVTGVSTIGGVRSGSRRLRESAQEASEEYEQERVEKEEIRRRKQDERQEKNSFKQQERQKRQEEKKKEQEARMRRMDHKVSGVAKDTKICEEEVSQDNTFSTETPADKQENRIPITGMYAPVDSSMQELHPVDSSKNIEDKTSNEITKSPKRIRKTAASEENIPDITQSSSVSLKSQEQEPDAIQQDIAKRLQSFIPETADDATVLAGTAGAAAYSGKTAVVASSPDTTVGAYTESVTDNEMIRDTAVDTISSGRASHRKYASEADMQKEVAEVAAAAELAAEQPKREYIFPDINLLKRGKKKAAANNTQELRDTALKLQTTLDTFGVKVSVTDISCGPSVTRYEIQPEMGVKVSRIVNLADDIKLNLAASDIRIEAPIPGKAAVGIEVPNKENVAVSFRDLIESNEFRNSSSKIAFALGRDISGKAQIADIAKMPHLLIAGATGSGKSVCINTIIMSVLYKANPDEVRLIMIDPKVVELNVYNGIPHLMIPVVTDPKKAAGALNWAVEEMTTRYQLFAESGVRKIDEYNARVAGKPGPDGREIKPMSQILIIVDELADLMMVASRDVEDAICRLAQLARAAGIHLVIATQRPSVNVITGLIKANMPSRIAFAVTSGIDSRTILDMNGAEKLLGKGDMLFHPQGAPKPIRVQGALVSDEEVSAVVEYIKKKNGPVSYSADVQEKMEKLDTGSTQSVSINDVEPDDGRDNYFAEAGQVIVDKEKASIGMLQRYLKIGFNRAARIMDQLEEAGVVGPEEGTKPRKVLMTSEQFQQFIDEQTNL